VLSGLDRGIKTLSAVAFALGAIVLICVTYADNTWFVLNVGVQTTGYYLQHLIQVGFDCEAFQQLNFELQVALHTDTTTLHTHSSSRAPEPPGPPLTLSLTLPTLTRAGLTLRRPERQLRVGL
jgi:hypothetical protein